MAIGHSKANPELTRTGIAGLDGILSGGIPSTNVILVQGETGSGKTLFGVEFICRGAAEFDEPGIIILFETNPEKLLRDCAAFNWHLDELQEQGKVAIILTSPEVLTHELRSPDSLLLEKAAAMGARRIFIDGISLLGSVYPDEGDRLHEVKSFRQLLQQVIESFGRAKLTAVLSHEIAVFSRASETLDIATLLVDTVIQLRQERVNRRTARNLEIVKSRGQEYCSGQHSLHIVSRVGLEVFRRVQCPVHKNLLQPTSNVKQSITGVAALDVLIGGGLYDGSTTMVVGISGAGKTVLGTHLLREGALRHSKKGLLVSLDEHPAQIIRNGEAIGLDLQKLIEDGTVHILFESPQELDIDAHFAQITKIVETYDIQRLVIDGMTSYSTAAVDQKVYRDFFHALVAFSKRRLMTSFFNYENPEFLGLSSFMPDFPVSSIVDNIILLNMVEIRSSIRRCITVVKARGCKHETDSREYRIGDGGINLLPFNKESAKAFSRYSSVLSRAPTRIRLRRAPRPAANVG